MIQREFQSILMIDASPYLKHLLPVLLGPEDIRLQHAWDERSALELLNRQAADLIVLNLPGTQGLNLCRQLKQIPELAGIPVVFLTDCVDVTTKVQAFDAGASDYITQPVAGAELQARIRAALRSKRLQDEITSRAQRDGLTGLWNRIHFDQRLEAEVSLWHRYGRPVSLIMLDIDHFKPLNDTYGHPFGDLVLQRVAELLETSQRCSEVACRYGGDEFCIILRETALQGAFTAAERIRRLVASLQLYDTRQKILVTASLGVSSNEVLSQRVSPAALLASADKALYLAKQRGRNRVDCASEAQSSPLSLKFNPGQTRFYPAEAPAHLNHSIGA